MLGQQPPISQALQGLARFTKQMRHRSFDRVEVALSLGDFADVKVREILLSLKSLPARPSFTDLLQQQIPFGSMPIRRWWLHPEITKGIPGPRPSLEVPPPGFPVGPADPLAKLLKQRAHGPLTINGGQ